MIRNIQVGTDQFWSVLFLILVTVKLNGHIFGIYTLVSELHDNVDLVLGLKNIFDLEDDLCPRDSCFKFLNRSVILYPKAKVILKPKQLKPVKVEGPFSKEFSGLVIIKLLDKKA